RGERVAPRVGGVAAGPLRLDLKDLVGGGVVHDVPPAGWGERLSVAILEVVDQKGHPAGVSGRKPPVERSIEGVQTAFGAAGGAQPHQEGAREAAAQNCHPAPPAKDSQGRPTRATSSPAARTLRAGSKTPGSAITIRVKRPARHAPTARADTRPTVVLSSVATNPSRARAVSLAQSTPPPRPTATSRRGRSTR